MARVNLGNGRWFDPKTATNFEENTRFDGRNMISCATGSQWEHEELYCTAKGVWILHSWSQWQGSRPSYEIISEEQAKIWLINQDHGSAAEAMFPGALEQAEL